MPLEYGIPKYIFYSAWDTANQVLVSDDEANHTLQLTIDDAAAKVPVNSPVTVGEGTYRLELDDSERTGNIATISGVSATEDVVLVPVAYPSDARIGNLTENDGSGNLRYTTKALETAPIADVSGLALESSVQQILTTGGTGPWTTYDDTALSQQISDGFDAGAKETTLNAGINAVLTQGGAGPWTTYNPATGGSVDVGSIAGVEITPQMANGFAYFFDVATPAKTMNDVGIGDVTIISGPIYLNDGRVVGLYRGDTFVHTQVLNFDLSNQTKVSFSVKYRTSDANADALILIELPGGLQVINGEAPTDSDNGSIEILDVSAGVIRVTLSAAESLKLPEVLDGPVADYEVQQSGGIVSTPIRHGFKIIGDVTSTILS